MSDNNDYDSDAPEEFTADQGLQENKKVTKLREASKARVLHESKERRRQWALKRTPKPAKKDESVKDVTEAKTAKEKSSGKSGKLPDEIVQFITKNEKKVFLSDSEEDEKSEAKTTSIKKRKPKSSGVLVLNEISMPECAVNSMDFLKKRKMQVPRSDAVLKNSNQALRLLSSFGLLN